jgi:hypothetical protein
MPPTRPLGQTLLEYPRQLRLNLVAGDESPNLGKWAVKERRPGTADYKTPVGRNPSGASISSSSSLVR